MSPASFVLLVILAAMWIGSAPLPVSLLGVLLTVWYRRSRYEDEYATSHG